MSDSPRALTVKQRSFIDEYLSNAGNGVQAARAAGYAGSDQTLRSVASENLAKPDIARAIEERLIAHEIRPERVLMQLARVAFADWEQFVVNQYDKQGNLVASKLQLADQVGALKLFMQYHGMLRDRIELTQTDVVRVLEYIKPPGVA